MIQTFASLLDWIGLVAFAATGALAAARKRMDIAGFMLLATATGIGGGTFRDLAMGATPVFWVRQPAYLIVCCATGALLFFVARQAVSNIRPLLWLDAAGLALYAVTGTETAMASGAGPVAALALGVATATLGGIIRDVLAGDQPAVLSREIYVTAAFVAAGTFVLGRMAGLSPEPALGCGFVAGFVLRAAAIIGGWSLPRYKAD
jgi:uncharacterized membrane protein YeiH